MQKYKKINSATYKPSLCTHCDYAISQSVGIDSKFGTFVVDFQLPYPDLGS